MPEVEVALAYRFARHAVPTLDPSTVVVIDEAGMASTADLHRTVTAAHAAGAKVVLVGDHHQLPEIGAGGGFATAVNLAGDRLCELTVNRRQTAPWERAALDEFRHGNTAVAYDAYRDHDRVTITDHPDNLYTSAVADWWRAHRRGVDALLLAGTRTEARLLNRSTRQVVAEHGHLTGHALVVGDRVFQVGDRVVLTRNDTHQTDLTTGRRCRVDNGTRGHIIAADADTGTIDITTSLNTRTRLDTDYVASHLDHGYAVTIHKSQGLTCDEVFVVGPAGLTREAGYVAMSRARNGAHLYATTRQHHDLTEQPHTSGIPLPTEATDPDDDLRRALDRSAAKQFATNANPHLAAAAHLAERFPLDRLTRRLDRIDQTIRELTADGHTDPTDTVGRLERARTNRERLHVGGRVRAHDRDNVGTVIAIVDQTGTAWIRFTNTDGAKCQRWMHWADTTPIDHPEHTPHLDERPVTPLGTAETARRLAELDQILATAPPDQTRIIRALHDPPRRRLSASPIHRPHRAAHHNRPPASVSHEPTRRIRRLLLNDPPSSRRQAANFLQSGHVPRSFSHRAGRIRPGPDPLVLPRPWPRHTPRR